MSVDASTARSIGRIKSRFPNTFSSLPARIPPNNLLRIDRQVWVGWGWRQDSSKILELLVFTPSGQKNSCHEKHSPAERGAGCPAVPFPKVAHTPSVTRRIA